VFDGIVLARHVCLLALAVTCAYTDLARGKLYNIVTLGGLAIGLALAYFLDAASPHADFHLPLTTYIVRAALGAALGGGVLFLLYLTGGFDAGDVKMMAAVAALASWPMAVYALMYTALAGGLLAFIVLILRGRLGGTFRRMFTLKTYRDAKSRADAEDEAERSAGEGPAGQADSPAPVTPPAADPEQIYIPYGPAIAAGAILAMLI